MKKFILLELIISVLVILWTYVAIAKLIDFRGFASAMRNQVFPNYFVPVLIWILPFSELLIAVMLIFERTRSVGLVLSSLLMFIFTGYVASVLMHFFRRVPCSCGGVIRQLGWGQHLIFNLFFLGLSISGFIIQRNKIRDSKLLAYGNA